MKKQRRRAGGAERGGDLLRDDAALAHAGDHDAAVGLAAAEDQLDGAGERFGHGASRRAARASSAAASVRTSAAGWNAVVLRCGGLIGF